MLCSIHTNVQSNAITVKLYNVIQFILLQHAKGLRRYTLYGDIQNILKFWFKIHQVLTFTFTGESGQKPLHVRSRSVVAIALTSNSASITAVCVDATIVSP